MERVFFSLGALLAGLAVVARPMEPTLVKQHLLRTKPVGLTRRHDTKCITVWHYWLWLGLAPSGRSKFDYLRFQDSCF